ncbi:MAG: hypothetical protein M5U26_29220 [Planctomycetota bacterium]|nr:hypothetical protein [Planctomycetota bacterium]
MTRAAIAIHEAAHAYIALLKGGAITRCLASPQAGAVDAEGLKGAATALQFYLAGELAEAFFQRRAPDWNAPRVAHDARAIRALLARHRAPRALRDVCEGSVLLALGTKEAAGAILRLGAALAEKGNLTDREARALAGIAGANPEREALAEWRTAGAPWRGREHHLRMRRAVEVELRGRDTVEREEAAWARDGARKVKAACSNTRAEEVKKRLAAWDYLERAARRAEPEEETECGENRPW